MPSVTVNPPKTPVTKGSSGIAAATLPNVCKMPGPPAPFVPTPLPNIGTSGKDCKGYSKKVKVEGQPVAIQGASFGSSGDIASKGTGGGIVSNNAEGPTTFLGPGSFDVKVEGKNVQLLGDQMLNNNGPPGSPPNAATMLGVNQVPGAPGAQMELNVDCGEKLKPKKKGKKKWDDCMVEQLCAMVKAYNESPHPKKKAEHSPSHPASKFPDMSPEQAAAQNAAFAKYKSSLTTFGDDFTAMVKDKGKDHPDVVKQFHSECQHKKWSDGGGNVPVKRSGTGSMNPDHCHPAGLGGPVNSLKWADSRVNKTVGPAMDKHDPKTHPGGVKAHPSCNCDK